MAEVSFATFRKYNQFQFELLLEHGPSKNIHDRYCSEKSPIAQWGRVTQICVGNQGSRFDDSFFFCGKPLSKPVMGYCQLEFEQSVEFKSKCSNSHLQTCILKCHWRKVCIFFLDFQVSTVGFLITGLHAVVYQYQLKLVLGKTWTEDILLISIARCSS